MDGRQLLPREIPRTGVPQVNQSEEEGDNTSRDIPEMANALSPLHSKASNQTLKRAFSSDHFSIPFS
jgi:hypothetical protein